MAPPIPLPIQASPQAEAADDFGTTSAVNASAFAVYEVYPNPEIPNTINPAIGVVTTNGAANKGRAINTPEMVSAIRLALGIGIPLLIIYCVK